ncbi:MAG: VWA domain-containing protein [Cytophagales bacterium]|nr:VWA domain-containing protein [Cytophagales bacterium]MDW8383185.1 VWA domain-containing protein [Flammeovirgaceae bacterium]
MKGTRFTKYEPPLDLSGQTFENLLKLFLQLVTITSGNVSQALEWLTSLDRQYGLTNDQYGIGDFIEDLKSKGYLEEKSESLKLKIELTAKSEIAIRRNALEEIFGNLKKSKFGEHETTFGGIGDEIAADKRPYQFGDKLEQIDMTETLRNAQINHGVEEFCLTEEDLEVNQREHKTQTSTVLMIDISHSMILYGEDRITPAKKVAMALAELIQQRYKHDTLDIIVFGNDAWQIQLKDLPYLEVGPYHTNTVAGLELAMDLLRRRKNTNKQIFMITDGKPTCIREGLLYYKNSFGLDRKIINKTLTLAAQCRKLNIHITTFMIASDPMLKQFVKEFTRINNGSAYYSSVKNLGNLLFEDFKRNRRRLY